MTKLKVYLASSFKPKENEDAVKGLAKWFESRGHTITCEWWHHDFKETEFEMMDDEWYAQPIIRTIYARSFKAIEDADMLVFVSPHPKSYNGANVEVGIALALRKVVVCFGQSERSGMYEPLIRCPTMDDLTATMREFEER